MRRAARWPKPLAPTLILLLSACATASFEPVVPPLVRYGPEVQAHAADELEALGPACPRDGVIADCSAVKRLVLDYLWLRDQVRAVE